MKLKLPPNIRYDLMSLALILFIAAFFTLSLRSGHQIPLNLTDDTYEDITLNQSLYNAYDFISTSSSTDQSILWNPNDSMGTPFLANQKNRAFSPFTLPFYLFSTYTAILLSILLKSFVAGCAAYYTARKLGYSTILCLMCAHAFQFSHYLLAQPLDPVSDALPWTPLLFLYAERLYLKQARYWPVGAVIIALMLLSGDGTAVTCAILAMITYLIINQKMHPHARGILLPLTAMLASIILGTALAAIQLIPHIHYLISTTPTLNTFPTPLPNFTAIPLLLFPNIDAPPQFGILHCGIAQILTTLLWLVMRPSLYEHQRAKIDGLQITSLTFLTITILYGTITSNPALTPHQLLLPWNFMMALATIITLSIWLELPSEQCKSVIRRGRFTTPLILIALYIPVFIQNPTPSMIIITTVLIAAYFFLLALTLIRPKAAWLGIGLIIINTIDLTSASSQNTYLQSPPDDIAEHQSNSRTAHRVTQFRQELNKRPELTNLTPETHVLIHLNQKQSIPTSFRSTLHLQSVTPTGQATFKKRIITTELQLLQEYRVQSQWDPAQLSPNLPPIIEQDIPTPPWPEPSPEPTYTTPPTNTSLAITAAPATDSILLINRVLDQHWQATIDGEPAPHFPVNGIFTGLQLTPGTHEIALTYISTPLKHGRLITLLAILLTALGYANLLYHRLHAAYLRT